MPDRNAVAESAIARRACAKVIPFVKVDLRGENGEVAWVPQLKWCHANVETWVHHNPNHKAVLGFLISKQSPGKWVIYNHSVVECEDGTLMDITPVHGEHQLPFIRHIGTAEEFGVLQGETGTEVSTDDC